MTKIREGTPDDASALLALNQESWPGVGDVSEPELRELIRWSWKTLIADEDGAALGFIVVLPSGLAYESPNYQWFERRGGGEALYVDRIAVAAAARGRSLGGALYASLIAAAPPSSALRCEVNLAPPNPGSLRFHQRLGFREVGTAAYQPGVKEVVFLERWAPAPR